MASLSTPAKKVQRVRRLRWPLVAIAALAVLAAGAWYAWPMVQRSRGIKLAAAGNMEAADPLLQNALERDKNDVRVLEALARGWLAADQVADSLRYAKRWCE